MNILFAVETKASKHKSVDRCVVRYGGGATPPSVDVPAFISRRYRVPLATARLIAELARIGRAAA